MSCSATKVHQAAFGKKDDILSINIVNINLWFDGIFCMTIVVIQPGYIDLDIEVTDITNDRFILHQSEMLTGDQVAATRSSNDDVSFFYCVDHFLYFESVHRCLQCADRIDLGNDHAATCTFQ